jgi:hypothetical protein
LEGVYQVGERRGSLHKRHAVRRPYNATRISSSPHRLFTTKIVYSCMVLQRRRIGYIGCVLSRLSTEIYFQPWRDIQLMAPERSLYKRLFLVIRHPSKLDTPSEGTCCFLCSAGVTEVDFRTLHANVAHPRLITSLKSIINTTVLPGC